MSARTLICSWLSQLHNYIDKAQQILAYNRCPRGTIAHLIQLYLCPTGENHHLQNSLKPRWLVPLLQIFLLLTKQLPLFSFLKSWWNACLHKRIQLLLAAKLKFFHNSCWEYRNHNLQSEDDGTKSDKTVQILFLFSLVLPTPTASSSSSYAISSLENTYSVRSLSA